MRISYSRFSSYLRCPFAHYLGYYECLKLKKPIRPLYFGSDFHKLLELRKDPDELDKAKKAIGEAYYDLSPDDQSLLGDDYIVDLQCIFDDYMRVYKDAKMPTQTERPFELVVGEYRGEKIVFNGVIDELYKFKRKGQKMCKLGEHKTFSQRPDLSVLVLNTQKNLYAKAVELMLGVMPESVIWDYICSKPASQPIWLPKSHRFSSARSNSITPFSWERACLERGIDDPEILAQGNAYSNNITNFFFRNELPIVPKSVELVWDGFLYTSRDIIRQGHKNKTKNITRDCRFCSYYDYCMTEMTGGDLNYLVEANYKVEPREEEEMSDG